MNSKLDNLIIDEIISTLNIPFSDLEKELSEKFSISPDLLRDTILSCDNFEDFLSKVNTLKKVEKND